MSGAEGADTTHGQGLQKTAPAATGAQTGAVFGRRITSVCRRGSACPREGWKREGARGGQTFLAVGAGPCGRPKVTSRCSQHLQGPRPRAVVGANRSMPAGERAPNRDLGDHDHDAVGACACTCVAGPPTPRHAGLRTLHRCGPLRSGPCDEQPMPARKARTPAMPLPRATAGRSGRALEHGGSRASGAPWRPGLGRSGLRGSRRSPAARRRGRGQTRPAGEGVPECMVGVCAAAPASRVCTKKPPRRRGRRCGCRRARSVVFCRARECAAEHHGPDEGHEASTSANAGLEVRHRGTPIPSRIGSAASRPRHPGLRRRRSRAGAGTPSLLAAASNVDSRTASRRRDLRKVVQPGTEAHATSSVRGVRARLRHSIPQGERGVGRGAAGQAAEGVSPHGAALGAEDVFSSALMDCSATPNPLRSSLARAVSWEDRDGERLALDPVYCSSRDQGRQRRKVVALSRARGRAQWAGGPGRPVLQAWRCGPGVS